MEVRASHKCPINAKSEYTVSYETKTLGILRKPKPDCDGFNLVIEQIELYTKL